MHLGRLTKSHDSMGCFVQFEPERTEPQILARPASTPPSVPAPVSPSIPTDPIMDALQAKSKKLSAAEFRTYLRGLKVQTVFWVLGFPDTPAIVCCCSCFHPCNGMGSQDVDIFHQHRFLSLSNTSPHVYATQDFISEDGDSDGQAVPVVQPPAPAPQPRQEEPAVDPVDQETPYASVRALMQRGYATRRRVGPYQGTAVLLIFVFVTLTSNYFVKLFEA